MADPFEVKIICMDLPEVTAKLQELRSTIKSQQEHILELQGFYGLVCASEKQLSEQVEAWKQSAKDWEAKAALLTAQLQDAKKEMEYRKYNNM